MKKNNKNLVVFVRHHFFEFLRQLLDHGREQRLRRSLLTHDNNLIKNYIKNLGLNFIHTQLIVWLTISPLKYNTQYYKKSIIINDL